MWQNYVKTCRYKGLKFTPAKKKWIFAVDYDAILESLNRQITNPLIPRKNSVLNKNRRVNCNCMK